MFGSVKVYAYIEWLAFKFRLPTQDWSHNNDLRCVFCNSCADICEFSNAIWRRTSILAKFAVSCNILFIWYIANWDMCVFGVLGGWVSQGLLVFYVIYRWVGCLAVFVINKIYQKKKKIKPTYSSQSCLRALVPCFTTNKA
ncbi:putative 4Fe-4S ferredoxin-type, iron-sulfur binding domain-containing protein [Helianthus annuus]|nr:putative 4Fe-4S ferredoxin-type, iron-sulfur binding domain-containing protein [Helianthus annuus]